ncbi:hypothetical protein EO95_09390 [Methanosarcina sp. 1.H.T.1A.1]|uniref:hypothetical protein n=1 Tax=Methanosarcina sp. 1.H.T.1A.1 TaxID=1483602 RepID=UPI000620F2F1|nr:hypothetical protein [Methanosarcina sp. 1.H.T.1A.1]KKH92881.1 hypothetical protein EO95_09390 [Methanosarcina sp. 1.H.T.1A.1]
MENKTTHLPAVLSFFVPGLGQLYKGKLLKFFIFYFIWSVLIFMAIGMSTVHADAGMFFFLVSGIPWMISLIDAYDFSD